MSILVGDGLIHPSFLGRRASTRRSCSALPGRIPFAITGVRIAIGSSLIAVLVAEFMASRAGTGFTMHVAGFGYLTDEIFAGVALIAAGAVTMTMIAVAVGDVLPGLAPGLVGGR
jgi:ABC-type nitrate/sulfonate/bicarbonate transport system permease component